MKKEKTPKRVRRDLTKDEQAKLDSVREEVGRDRDRIVAEGKIRKAAWEKIKRNVQKTVAELKQERERRGLTLADVEEKSGIKCSALSRLENNVDPNPTLLVLHRYANAMGVSLVVGIER